MKQTIVLGGGCFWCIEAVFCRVVGVSKVTPGYAGGKTQNPTYEVVSLGGSGHAEVVKVEFDDSKIRLSKILELFFNSHDPTTPDRQGSDVGSQYRSIILYRSNQQRKEIEVFMRALDYGRPILTEVKKLERFYPA